jgi:hypothetical protein
MLLIPSYVPRSMIRMNAILVIGGTGTVGRQVISQLSAGRHTTPSPPQLSGAQQSQLPSVGAFQVFVAVSGEKLRTMPGRHFLRIGRHVLRIARFFTHKNQVMRSWLSVRAAVNGQVRTGNVCRFRTSDERDQRGNFVDSPIPAESGIRFLRCRPIARGGI